jgi:hypothetical protein
MLAAGLFASVGVDSYQPLLIADLIVGGMGVRERSPGQVLRPGRSTGLLWSGGERRGELAAGADAERGEDFPQVVDESAAGADVPFRLAVPGGDGLRGPGCHARADGLGPRSRTGRPQNRGAVMAGTNDSDARAAVAVIGAGIMGSAMARNLVTAGLDTRVWDRSPAATGPLADAGAVVLA